LPKKGDLFEFNDNINKFYIGKLGIILEVSRLRETCKVFLFSDGYQGYQNINFPMAFIKVL